MTGLPMLATFWIYSFLYPVHLNWENYEDLKWGHYFILGLVAWHVTIGPLILRKLEGNQVEVKQVDVNGKKVK